VIGTGSTAGSNTLVSINGDGTGTIFAQPKVTIGDATAEDTMLAFDGNALDFHISLDDSADDLVIGTGTTAGSNTLVSINGDATGIELKVPTVTVGDGTAEDTQVKFDGNALDFHVGLDDSADDLVIGTGSTLGTNTIVSINGDATGIELKVPTVTVGDGTAEDTMVAFDGNALDFHISLDDSADDLVIGTGTTAGSNTLISVNGDGSETKFNQPKVTIGDATAEDTYIIFDGNAQDFRIGLDDGTDKLEIGGGAAHGTAAGIAMDVNGDMTLGGGIVCSDEEISRPKFKDYAETINALGDVGGGTDAIDFTAGNVVSATVSTGAQTFTFTNPPADGVSGSFTLFLTNGGSQTVNWPGAVDWAGGDAPSLTSSGVDVLTFTTLDAGTIWYGFAAGLDMG
jgi:3D (Asp-Asp-Asp) domain-containing protein